MSGARLLLSGIVAQVSVTPDPAALPGGAALARVINGVSFFGIGICTIGLIVGACLLALGNHGTNYSQVQAGKRTLVSSALGAALVGGSAVIINWAVGLGQSM